MYYSVAGRDIERELVPLANDQKLAILPWSPLAGGFLSGKYSRDNEKPEGARRATLDFPPVDRERLWRVLDVMRPIADDHLVSVAQVALAWLLAQPHVTSVIIGAKNQEQLLDNIAATELTLSAEQVQAISEASALPERIPAMDAHPPVGGPARAGERPELNRDRMRALTSVLVPSVATLVACDRSASLNTCQARRSHCNLRGPARG